MTDLIQPGPQAIGPLSCPGGVVIHVYGVPSGTLLTVSHADSLHMAAYNAGLDGERAEARLPATDHAFCLVGFDGDTGRRFTADEWVGG